MNTFFRDLIKSEAHSLIFVRDSLEIANENKTEFFPLLREHHIFLQESIDVLMDKGATDREKQDHLVRFLRLLEMHGRAEQETLYMYMKANVEKEARIEGFGGQDEHDVAFQLEDELLEMGYLTSWSEEIAAKAKTLAGLVKNHIKEEESVMFSVARKDLTEAELEILRKEYLAKCKTYLDESRINFTGKQILRSRTISVSARI